MSKNDDCGVFVNVYKHPTKQHYWTGTFGYKTEKMAIRDLADKTHYFATIDIKKAVEQQKGE